MIRPAIRKAILLMALISCSVLTQSQAPALPGSNPVVEKTVKKPYKILTSGKTITIKSNVNLKNLIIWTAGGNRVVEQKNLSKQEFSFTSTIRESVYFILMEMENGQRFTEKIGI